MKGRESEWALLMKAARTGDAAAYRRCLSAIAEGVRPMVRRRLARLNRSDETEDVVQEILLAVHLKRHSWDDSRPIGPWLAAIARYKLIDALRRRGSRVEVPIEELADTLPAAESQPDTSQAIARSLAALPGGQRAVVQSIAVDGASIADTAKRLTMTEGAVRVTLHRGLAALAKRAREST